MAFKLTRNLKIQKSADYQVVFNQGQIFKGKYWQIIAKKTNASTPRIGLIVSKKKHRLAVNRNKYKRIARETFRTHQNDLHNWEFIVMAKNSITNNHIVVANDLLNLFKKAAL